MQTLCIYRIYKIQLSDILYSMIARPRRTKNDALRDDINILYDVVKLESRKYAEA